MCLEHREKAKQHKKKVRASMKHTRDDAELSDASTEVLRTPPKHIRPTRMRQENTPDGLPPRKCPKVCCLFTQHIIQGSFTTIGYFISEYVNLTGLLCDLKSQIKTSGSGGLHFDGYFKEDRNPYINEKEYINGLCHHIHITTGYRCRCDLGSTNKPHSRVDPDPRVSLSEGVVGKSTRRFNPR